MGCNIFFDFLAIVLAYLGLYSCATFFAFLAIHLAYLGLHKYTIFFPLLTILLVYVGQYSIFRFKPIIRMRNQPCALGRAEIISLPCKLLLFTRR